MKENYKYMFEGNLSREDKVKKVLEVRRDMIARFEDKYGLMFMNQNLEGLIGLPMLTEFTKNGDSNRYFIIKSHRKLIWDLVYDFADIKDLASEYEKAIIEMKEIGKIKNIPNDEYVDKDIAKDVACILTRKSFSMTFEEMLNSSDTFLEHCIEFIDVLRG